MSQMFPERGDDEKDTVDYAKCKSVFETGQKVMDTQTMTIEWMNGELANHFQAMLVGAYTSVHMSLLKRGVPAPQAEESAKQQVLLIALDLGIRIGKEMAGADELRDMLGPDFGKDFDL